MRIFQANHKIAITLLIFALPLIIAACSGNGASADEVPAEDIKTEQQPDEAVAVQPKTTVDTAEQSQIPQQQADSRIAVDADFEVRPIEEVFSIGPPDLQVLSDSEAQLLFVSDIPLACSIVYGETTAYGSLTLDQDMDGGAHTDHHPILPNLKPDTLYHYRLQGSAEDGAIYMSEDMTFRTPPEEATTEVNLASMEAGAQVIAVSSNFGGATNDESWGANSALDGSRGSEWSSNGDGNDAFIEIALAQPSRLHAVEIWTRAMSNNTAQIFELTITTDSGEVLGPFTLPDATQAYRFDVDVVAGALRLDVVDSNGGNTGLVEFAAYGTPVED